MSGNRTTGVLLIVGFTQIAAAVFATVYGGMTSPYLPLYLMAYTLGMRHALDADHIAAIDNVSRSMLSRGERPTGVGLLFALGHSAVVGATTLLAAVGASKLQGSMSHLQTIVATLSSVLAAAILFYLAPRNWRVAWRILRTGTAPIDSVPGSKPGGLVSRLLARFLTARLRGWHMLLIGALFGLGFETATALSMMALVGTQSAQGLRVANLAIFPVLFTAGMVLVDALDGVLMERAYGWALKRPSRHLIYNFSVTLVSALLALFIGLFEAAAAVKQFVAINGNAVIDYVEGHMDAIGAAVIIGFALAYGVAALRSARKISPAGVKTLN